MNDYEYQRSCCDGENLFILAIISGIMLFALIFCGVEIYNKNREIRILQKEKVILVDNYLSNIQRYKCKKLWINEADKQEFLKWLRESAERQTR